MLLTGAVAFALLGYAAWLHGENRRQGRDS